MICVIEEGLVTKNDLRIDLEQRVHNFIQDNYEWDCFVQEHYDFETQTGSFEIAVRYMMLVDKYCVPEKRRHGGMSLTNMVHHLPSEETIISFKDEDKTAIVSTEVKWQTGYRKGSIELYDYVFECVDEDYFLDQIYLITSSNRFECL